MRDRYAGLHAADRLCLCLMAGVLFAAALMQVAPGRSGVLPTVLAMAGALNIALLVLCKSYGFYHARGKSISAHLRFAETALISITCLTPLGAQDRLWMLGIPLVICEGLVERSGRRPTIAMVFIALGAIIGAWHPHVAVVQLLAPIVLLTAAAGAAAILTRYRMREELLQARDRRMDTLMNTATAVAGRDLNTTVLNTLQASVRDLGATAGFVALVSDDSPGELVVQAAYSPNGSFTFPERIKMGTGVSGYVVKMGQPISIHATGTEKIDCDGIGIDAKAAVSVPLITRGSSRAGQAVEEHAIGAMTLAYCDSSDPVDREDLDMLQSLSSLLASAVANQLMEVKQRTTFLQTLESLATALEARDEYTRGHSHRVCEVSLLIGQSLRFSADALEELRIGTTLHDIGKIGVPDAILNKPGRLTDEEFVIMKSHTTIGYEICRPLTLSEGVLMIIRNHHEKLDGSGYPDGLKGGELPLSLRTVCVADAFDAMSSRRPYRGVMDINDVIRELGRGAGVQFDPVIVETIKDLLHKGALDEIYAKYWHPKEEAA